MLPERSLWFWCTGLGTPTTTGTSSFRAWPIRFGSLPMTAADIAKASVPTGPGSVREDVADLATLIEHLGLVPAWVVGNSFGASITLRLAGERPELFRGLIGHEPPLLSLLSDDPALAPLVEEVDQRISAVVDRIASGDHAGAAEQFVETVALGPGTWTSMPIEFRQTLIENASTFLERRQQPRAAWLRPRMD